MSHSEFDPKHFVSNLTTRPGVYRMYDVKGELLYVGKAKNLKNRVASYFRVTGLTTKTMALVSRIHTIEIAVTKSETEALLLEQTLIKQHRPPYNILLRDDKSYPYILLSNHPHPALLFRRGDKTDKGTLFGPFPSGSAVKESLNTMQKVFKVRQCEDSTYSNRSRPCLQYQIKRCSGPCVNLISDEEYELDVRHARMFLQGKDQELTAEITTQMSAAAADMEFERAAELRDQIIQLKHIQEQQHVYGQTGEADVIASIIQPGGLCVHVMMVRKGKVVGSKSYYPKMPIEITEGELLSSFIAQFYLGGIQELPKTLIISHELEDGDALVEGIFETTQKKIEVLSNVRGQRARWLELAKLNAEQGLQARLSDKRNHFSRITALQKLLGFSEPPMHMECFDISHSSGEATVASCVVFGPDGPDKKRYRSFNIEGVEPGDDYGAMKQALTRRYKRVKSGELEAPDVLLIDGGKGQLTQAETVLKELGLVNIFLLGVAKGDTRKPGLETLYIGSKEDEVVLPPDSAALHLIQHIRDEAHRFAIKTHRRRRDKKRRHSVLEDIPGIGPNRRKELLTAFGGYQELLSASQEDISKVKGISAKKAEEIYLYLHKS
ncbi:MAG: excinuclease ABC subunit UvrC [Gammaproteobacteria bacterium]|uniref:excinuclease ABC subunit UvrC n=1 Tax=Marinomonas sp. BSi20584 TaxID=1594462 RepID=UPI000C1E1D84|nr:excinuclease ABC subunit UvrC [Marinomonas sp. BSi20584]MBU2412362.1 excinuclease ABC subunit UvrC [Gammaproteobacteria bacterium]PJE55530.1 excinuclease ABC subunit C [Marinomonas sp. BSi20584]